MKKLISTLTAAAMLCGMSASLSVGAETFVQGDVNMDGILTGHDAAIVSKYADGILEMKLSDEQLKLADMNGDGEITQDDAALIAEKQEYGLFALDAAWIEKKYGQSMISLEKCEKYSVIKMIDPNISFGVYDKRADIDCNGIVDRHDAMLLCYSLCFWEQLGESAFKNGKYYISDPAPVDDRLKQWIIGPVEGRNCESWTEFFDKVMENHVPYILDVNEDSKLDISDATDILTVYANSAAGISQEHTEPWHIEEDHLGFLIYDNKYDVSDNGKVDIEDATLVLKGYAMRAAGLI